MSNHHGHHRSSSHRSSRSRMYHSSSSSSRYQSMSSRTNRNSTSNTNNNGAPTQRMIQVQTTSDSRDSGTGEWSEHHSSSGKVYYYNKKTGVSQWEPPAELRQPRSASPESELSESSSIRQQDNSPSSSASSNNSAQSESISDDKPLLTPSLAQYYKPELITDFNSSHVEELERQANEHAREALILNERILEESVNLKLAKSFVLSIDTSLEAQIKKREILIETINNYGFI